MFHCLLGDYIATGCLQKTIYYVDESYTWMTPLVWEVAEHLLFSCDIFGNVWSAVLKWLGLSFVAPVGCRDHYIQFRHLAGLLHSSHSFLQIIRLAYVWTIWKERNNRIFNQNSTGTNIIPAG
ncbi:hypothetical protein MtrunA17_Chr8g0376041 [Medicago truncatula]|uniref:Uncharacterized protein n=1 Tax=Medicago truncatula TaxID=3880 RepID=A0A396GMI8_MEDTR|nr:hypothetical protein MtrunA17_Chr8g0376041 [Medicago truncatula]